MQETTPILTALIALCKFKGSATYTELASVTGKKKLEVLNVLNRNQRLLSASKAGKVSLVSGPTMCGDAAKRNMHYSGKYYIITSQLLRSGENIPCVESFS